MTNIADDSMTIDQFIEANGLTMTVKRATRNPHMDDTYPSDMDHWRCTIGRLHGAQVRTMRVIFSMGSAHKGKPPALRDVLDCVAADASGFENTESFFEWAKDYGYDTDSRKAERIYNTIRRQAAKLKLLLGEQAYDTLLWKLNRL